MKLDTSKLPDRVEELRAMIRRMATDHETELRALQDTLQRERNERIDICCKSEFPIVAEEIPQALGGEFWLPPHERVPHSVALSVKDQQVAVVHEAVDQSRGHGLVEEDIHPPAELQVCGDEHAAFLVAG
jgi:hypothetical protein